MRRTVARIGLVAALALSMSVTAATAPPASADDNVGLVSPARSAAGPEPAGLEMCYASLARPIRCGPHELRH